MIIFKTKEEIKVIREGGKILANILEELVKMVKPGVTAADLEETAVRMIEEAGGRPAFKGFMAGEGSDPFPTALCTSVNNEIVHGPATSSRVLNEGDIIGIDVGMEYPVVKKEGYPQNKYSKLGGYYTDMAKTVAVGVVDEEAKKLINITRECLNLAIKQVKPGNTLRDIARVVQKHAETHGFSVVRDLVGHGVGVKVHEDPKVPNYEINSREYNLKLEPGMVIAVEPMINTGDYRIRVSEDGMTFETLDGSLSAHFEHTIAVTDDGCEVLTRI